MKKILVQSSKFGVGFFLFSLLSSIFLLPSISHAADMPESVKAKSASFAKKNATTEITEATSTPAPWPTVAATPAAASAAAPAVSGSEAQNKLQAIKTQEQWVGKLTKQLEGETKQLKEMRESYAQAFGKEPK